ncbi:MAG: hypothetical protein K9N23_15545 [Akkermansiaceae bacterium]|nr:hypothetical protein [Akkermansiaceae bacterium]
MKISNLIWKVGLFTCCTVALAAGENEWKSFENADGNQSFTARVVSYDAKRDSATMIMKKGGQRISVALSRLKEADQAYVKEQAQILAANSSFRFKFDKFMEETASNRIGDTTTTTYHGGYRVAVSNYSSVNVEDVEVEDLVIWRKDSFEGMGDDQFVTGSHQISTIFAGSNDHFTTAGIQMQGVVKKGSSSTSGGACPTCPTSTVTTRTLRSRDQLVGCIVRIRIAGKVVRTEANNAAVLKKYQDRFPSVAED